MFRNYLRTALRILWKQKPFTFINIVGLAFGTACFIFILLYVLFELSYDDFHDRADQICRVAIERKYPDRVRLWGLTPFPAGRTFAEEFPEIIQGTRVVTNARNNFLIRVGDKNLISNRVVFADPNFFEVFTFPLVQGNPQKALVLPNSAVLTSESAKRLFGDENPLGRTLNINAVDYTVMGITSDVPLNSHFHFDYVLSLITIPNLYNGNQWINAWGAFTYILLREDADAAFLESKLEKMVEKYMAPEVAEEVKVSYEEFIASGNGYRFFLQPLRKIHLTSHLDQEIEANGNLSYVTLFSLISGFILLIACINFMNLATAKSAGRAKEVGIRKTVGSARGQLIFQFLLESTVFSGLALAMALGIVLLFLPAVRTVTGIPFSLGSFPAGWAVPSILGAILIIGFLAGSYPAFFLSAFPPVAGLKGRLGRGPWVGRFRNILVVFQFTVSIVLIVGTLVVSRQIIYMMTKNLGYDKESVVVIHNANILGQQYQAFKEAVSGNPDVVGVSGSIGFPGGAVDGNVHAPEGTTDSRAVSLSMIFADYDYIGTMGMELAAGRNFSREYGTDATAYILNETAVKLLGLKDPIGARITDHNQVYTVIGVLKDFHFRSLHDVISPVAVSGNLPPFANYISVRIRPGRIPETLRVLEANWERVSGGRPFAFSFLDDDLYAQYQAEKRTRGLSAVFSSLAVLIACLGLFGLAAFTAERRTKEIGVRKVVGASVINIVCLMAAEFVKLVGLSFLIAAPVAFWIMHRWLGNFAYHAEVGLFPFLLAGLIAMGIALLTVSFQAVKAALRNPIESLRYE